jgi:hypothetical protein
MRGTWKIPRMNIREVMNMFERLTFEKEKRKKRLENNNRKKTSAYHKYGKSKRHIRRPLYQNQNIENWELINSR